MRQLLLRPGDEAFALILKKGLQIGRGMGLDNQRLFLRRHIEVHQRQLDVWQTFFLAQQMAVHLELRPVQMPVVLTHGIEVAAKGLDLFKLAQLCVVTIGPAAHAQAFVVTAEADFGLVVRRPALRHHPVTRHAFERRR